MSKIFVLLLLGLALTNTTAQPKNVEAKAEGMISIPVLYTGLFIAHRIKTRVAAYFSTFCGQKNQ